MSQISKQAIHFKKNLINTCTQIRHTGWGKKAKKNKRTWTSIRDTRVHSNYNYKKAKLYRQNLVKFSCLLIQSDSMSHCTW